MIAAPPDRGGHVMDRMQSAPDIGQMVSPSDPTVALRQE
jgi:hypothetical protein